MSSAARLGQRRRWGAEATRRGVCPSRRPAVLRPAQILWAAPNTHSQHRQDSWQRPSVVKMGSRGMGAQGTSEVRFIGGETEAEPQRLFPIRLAVIARCGLVRPGPLRPPPRLPPAKRKSGSGGLDFSLQLSFLSQLSPPERAPASLALRLAPSVEWGRLGVAWHSACTPPALCTRELLGRLPSVSSPRPRSPRLAPRKGSDTDSVPLASRRETGQVDDALESGLKSLI